jgi:polygalacturonase
MKIIIKISAALFLFVLFFASCSYSNGDSILKKYGIENNGLSLCTEALQKALDDCAERGGGIVSLPSGKYLTGTIFLRENVTLNLEKDAVIYGSPDMEDYPRKGRRKALILAENANNIAITGEGEINGNGNVFNDKNNNYNRPTLVQFFDCTNVQVHDIKMKDASIWAFRVVRCDSVDIKNIYIESHVNWNNVGMSIESRNVTISDCVVDTDDDALCFKSEDLNFVVENIQVKNCRLSSNCNFIKFGTASAGGFRNIEISGCELSACNKSPVRSWAGKIPGVGESITGIAGIALQVVDGGSMEKIKISDIKMQAVQTPLFIRLGQRTISDNSYLKDIIIENITANSTSCIASSITGVPGLNIENVQIKNCNFTLKAGGKLSDVYSPVPEMENGYPENRMFNHKLPAYGLYIRHVDKIELENLNFSFVGENEERPAIYSDNVKNLQTENLNLQKTGNNLPAIFIQ